MDPYVNLHFVFTPTMIPEHYFSLINALLEQIFAQIFRFRALILLENDQKRTLRDLPQHGLVSPA